MRQNVDGDEHINRDTRWRQKNMRPAVTEGREGDVKDASQKEAGVGSCHKGRLRKMRKKGNTAVGQERVRACRKVIYEAGW